MASKSPCQQLHSAINTRALSRADVIFSLGVQFSVFLYAGRSSLTLQFSVLSSPDVVFLSLEFYGSGISLTT